MRPSFIGRDYQSGMVRCEVATSKLLYCAIKARQTSRLQVRFCLSDVTECSPLDLLELEMHVITAFCDLVERCHCAPPLFAWKDVKTTKFIGTHFLRAMNPWRVQRLWFVPQLEMWRPSCRPDLVYFTVNLASIFTVNFKTQQMLM